MLDGGTAGEEVDSPSACLGRYTTPDCLSVRAFARGAQRRWSPLDTDSALDWVQAETPQVSGLFGGEDAPEWLEERLGIQLNTGEGEVHLSALIIDLPEGSTALEVELTGLKADRVFQAGYQSWSFSGGITVPSSLSRDEEGHLTIQEAFTGDPVHGAHGVSFGLIGGQLGDEGSQGAWLIGKLDPTYALTALGAEVGPEGEGDLKLTVRVGFSDIPLRDQRNQTPTPNNPGVGIQQELILVTAPTMWLALRAYQEALGERLELLRSQSIRSTGSKRSPLRPPRGWYSWNERFEDVDEGYIAEHLELVAERLSPYGMRLVELDDGWQRGWGEWLPNERFPDEFNTLTARARALNLTLGLWLAPFLVDVEVAERLNYPREWFVYPPLEEAPTSPDDLIKPSELTGEPLRHNNIGNPRTYYVLDTTHPEAMTHLLTQLTARAEQGFGFFKLDFLYAGAIPGRRAQALSGTESLRLGLQKIREAIGEEAVINACGAPVHAVLGYADSLRVGADTTFGDLYPAFIASAARSSAARAYLFPLVWPDGDQVQTRSPYSPEEAEVGAYVASLSGPAYSVGDDLTRLPTARLAIFTSEERRWWAELGAPALPLDLMARPAQRWFANPLADQLSAPGSTSAPPPTTYLGQDNQGVWRLLRLGWEPALSASWERLSAE